MTTQALLYITGGKSGMVQRRLGWELLEKNLALKADCFDNLPLYLNANGKGKAGYGSSTLVVLCHAKDVDAILSSLAADLEAVAVPVLASRLRPER
jgi:hypothetical protein